VNAAPTIPAWRAPTARVEPPSLGPGQRGRIVLTIDVPEGCHVQSHTPAEPFLIPTTVELGPSDDVALGAPTYPEGEVERFEWSPVVLDVYRGAVEIVVPVVVETGANPGRRTVFGRVRYQGCTQTACLAPAETGVEVHLDVSEKEER
jgi:hypothetical protein